MKKIQYSIIKHVDSWENPIAKDGFYDDCQIAEFTGFMFNDTFYEVLNYKNETLCVNSVTGEPFEIPDEELDWMEDSKMYLYYDDESGKYFAQETNGNFWAEITEPILIEVKQ